MEVTTGTTPVTCDPGAPVSRGQMTTFISRLQNFLTGEGFDAGEADYFNDDDGTTHEANINAVASTGVAQGTDVGKFSPGNPVLRRSEEHTSELQSLMRISYAVFCLKKQT